jgi:tetratricopeptide (TPR) repeat protein
MNCTNCNYDLPENAKFCPECGQKITSIEVEKKTEKSHISKKSKSFTKPSQAYGFITLCVVIALTIVFLILDSNRETIEEKKRNSSNTVDIPEEIKVKLEQLAANPESVPLNIEIANLLFDHNQFDQAIPFYQRALQGDPANIAVQIDMAVCYFNLRQFDQAIAEMEKALRIDPDHPKGLFNMGIIYYNLKDFDKVREYWEKLFAAHPDGMEAKRANELLQSLESPTSE